MAEPRAGGGDRTGVRPPTWRQTVRSVLPELILGACLGFAYLMRVPLWEAPDEPYHLTNILYVRKYGLYTLTHGASELPVNMKGESSQPPLYYAVGALVARVLRRPPVEFGAMEHPECWDQPWKFYNWGDTALPRVLRGLSLAFLLACGLLSARAGALAAPGDTHLPGTTMAMVWAVPQVLFVGTTISNDAMAMASGALLFVLWLGSWRDPSWWRPAVAGVVTAGALAVKFTLVPYAVAGALVSLAFGPSWRARCRNLALFLGPTLVALAFLALVAPDAAARVRYLLETRVGVQPLRLRPLLVLPLAWESFWARFGWMNVPVAPEVRVLFWSVSVALSIGLGATIHERRVKVPLLVALVLVCGAVGAFVLNLRHSGQVQGRHLFGVIAPLSLLGAWGLRGYLSPLAARWTAGALAACGSAYVVLSVMPAGYGEEPSDLLLGEACCSGSQITPCLDSRREAQTFIASMPRLCRVGVVPATHGLPVRGRVRLWLQGGDAVLAQRTISGKELKDGRWLFLDFPPIPESEGRRYTIVVEPVGKVRGMLHLFYSPRDLCPNSRRLTGEGDLRFASYHVGDPPPLQEPSP